MKSYSEELKPYVPVNRPIWVDSNLIENYKQYLMLDWNESTRGPSPLVIKKLQLLTKDGNFYRFYPDVDNKKLLAMIADYVGIKSTQVLPFPSSDTAHEYIVRTWLKYNDTVVISTPTYDNFRITAESVSGNVVYCKRDKYGFKPENLMKKIDDYKIKVAYICNPNNPTGEYIDIAVVEQMLKHCPKTLFLLDEAYIEFSGGSAASLASVYDNIVITRTFSKAFGLANFRIGYVISNEANIRRLSKIRNTKNISTFSQVAAMTALEDLDYMYAYVKDVKEAKNWFIEQVNSSDLNLRCKPSMANFILMQFPSVEAKNVMLEHLNKNFIFVRKLSQSELKTCLRISVGDMEQMKYVLNIMKEV